MRLAGQLAHEPLDRAPSNFDALATQLGRDSAGLYPDRLKSDGVESLKLVGTANKSY